MAEKLRSFARDRSLADGTAAAVAMKRPPPRYREVDISHHYAGVMIRARARWPVEPASR